MTQAIISTLPFSPKHQTWLCEAARLPLGFAQVREDALLDLKVLSLVKANADVCLVASGGCTAAYLAASADVKSICLVDTNEAQLLLSRFKLHLLQRESTESRLSLLGHLSMPAEQRFDKVNTILNGLQTTGEKLAPQNYIAEKGLDYSGRYERLFNHLQRSFANSAQADLEFFLSLEKIVEQVRFVAESGLGKLFDSTFADTFALKNLVALFGKQATENAHKPFAIHFRERLQHAIEILPSASNPYLYQFLAGRYPENFHSPWLHCPAGKTSTRLDYIHASIGSFLENKKEHFDMIGLSNILDWLNASDAKTVLQAAFEALKPGGLVFIRQLNSRANIPEIAPDFAWQNTTQLQACDRSFFYRQLHLGLKP